MKQQVVNELWYRGELSWKLHETQLDIYNCIRELPVAVREVLVFCSRRLGKTFLGVLMAIEDCLRSDGVEVAIIGPNLKQTKSIITPILNIIKQDAPEGVIKQQKSELLWRVGNSQLVIAAFDTASESIRGRAFHNIYLEESGLASMLEYDYTLNSILRPTLMHSRGRIVHLTTPAKEVNHPLHTVTLPACAANGALYKYTIRDNPLLTENEIQEEIDSLGGMASVHVKRELFCQIAKDDSSIIVPEFEDRHIKPITLPEYALYQTSIDFGGSMDKHGLLLTFWDFKRAKFCVYREALLDKNTPTNVIKQKCVEMEEGITWLNGPMRLGDAPGQLRIDLGADDFYVRQPSKGKDSVEANVNALRLALQRDEIEIDPSCKKLIATLQYGSWLENKKDWVRTKELGHLDLLAALLYAYRHKLTGNPYPFLHNIHPDTHYIDKEESEEGVRQLFNI